MFVKIHPKKTLDLMLEANDISKTIKGKQILKPCSLCIMPGEFTAVVGPNGAGKSTLLRILSGEDKASSGEVFLNGQPLKSYNSKLLSRMRAVLPQSTTLTFPFTVEQVVEIGRYSHATSEQQNRQIIAEILQRTGLTPFRDRAYQTLSGGEQQRVQMARVLAQLWHGGFHAREPRHRYLLLDEPTSSLDLAQQQKLLSLARDSCKEGVGVLAILHDLNLAMQYADRILFLKKGQTVAYGLVAEVVTQTVIEDTFSHPVRLLHDQGQWVVVPQAYSNVHFVKLNEQNHE
ncbi:MAG: heme ABC transporter ATP-binding protein [Cyclobacteriaceae bacterium]